VNDVKVCPTCGSEYPLSERFCPRDGSALRGKNPESDLSGSVVGGRYHVMRKLGEGGMGTVYLAEHVKMGRKSALKVMNPGMTKDADAIARFNREASNASRLNHPNICSIYDFGETEDGMIYLAMEFIEGRSLTDIIQEEGSLTPARAASILHQAADGLQVAHDSGIVHRDLKPDNIMIAKGRDGADVVKVVDFGIAKAHTSDAQKVTKTGLVVGTPEYMSPEQLAGDKLDGRSDIYSLALVGFNMLTGHLPFPSHSAQEAMIMRLTDSPKTLADMRPDVVWPRRLQAVMDKALARDAIQRYQHAADFGREFSMAIDAMPSQDPSEVGTLVIDAGGKKTPIPRTRVDGTPEPEVIRREPAHTPVARKNAAMMFGAGGFVVVALGAFIAFKAGLIGGGTGPVDGGITTPPANQTTPPVTDTSGTGRGAQAASGATGSTGQLGATNAGRGLITNPPPVASTGSTGGQSQNPPTTLTPVTPEELADLKKSAEEIDIERPDTTRAAAVVSEATKLLPRAEGESRAEILARRGMILFITKRKVEACRDLREARTLTRRTGLRQNIDAYFDESVMTGACSS
jgi:serine/threonine protein kinase